MNDMRAAVEEMNMEKVSNYTNIKFKDKVLNLYIYIYIIVIANILTISFSSGKRRETKQVPDK